MQVDIQRKPITSHATFKSRIYAFLFDYLIIAIYGVFVVGTLSFLFRSFFIRLFSNSPITAELTGFLLLTLPISLYFIWCESFISQGTWGKRKMGIRVVNCALQPIGIGRSIIRTAIKFLPWEAAHFAIWRIMLPSHLSETTILVILYAVNATVLIYLLSPLLNKKRKTVYDWVAGTEVIRQ